MTIVWRKKAISELESIFKFIKKSSPQNALLVFNSIIDLVDSLPNFPYKYAIEPILNNTNIRFAVLWSYKIVYFVGGTKIVILRVFNTKQKPKKLLK